MPSSLLTNWKLGDRPELGAMNTINSFLRSLDLSDAGSLPCLDSSNDLLLGTDYGGQHSSSHFESFAFVITGFELLGPYLQSMKGVRARQLPNGRRMSFKALNDKQRMAALPDYLATIDLVHGLVLVVLVDKRIESLFDPNGRLASTEPEFSGLRGKPKTIEKLLRVCHFASLLVAGLSRPGQNLLWLTDQDDIAANLDMHHQLVDIFGNIASHYLEHTLGHLRIATTASDTDSRTVEDFVSIADMAAGAIGDVVNSYRRENNPMGHAIVPQPSSVQAKTMTLMNWFSNSNTSLRRLALSIEPGKGTSRLMIRKYNFFGSNDIWRWV